jgi:hypothetical protein
MVSNKGQGLSLTTIIVAALALIVLVVLVMVFTGRIGSFEKGLSEEGKVELVKMRIQYSDCSPTASNELTFDTALSAAENTVAESSAKAEFLTRIDYCKGFSNDKAVCEANGCKWS